MTDLVFRMTREEAGRFGLLTCANCGHPQNNHFDHGPCAHCKCDTYVEKARVGRLDSWIKGSGEGLLKDGSWAYVCHPLMGVFVGHLEWYSDEGNLKIYTWTDYADGASYKASEVTHYMPMVLPEKPV